MTLLASTYCCGFTINLFTGGVQLINSSSKYSEELKGTLAEGREFFIESELLKAKRFKTVEVNKFGFKTLLKHENFELMLTKNNKIIAYSEGIPSVLGYPSDVPELSGIYFDSQGIAVYPTISFLDNERLSETFEEMKAASFNYNPSKQPNHFVVFSNKKLSNKKQYKFRKEPLIEILGINSQFNGVFSKLRATRSFLYSYSSMLRRGDVKMVTNQVESTEEVVASNIINNVKFLITEDGASISFGTNHNSIYNMPSGYTGYCPLGLLSLGVEHFDHLPVNDRGYKTLVESDSKSLELTATGKIVMYEDGMPSLFGYPSDFYLFSGPIIIAQKLLVPKETIFNQFQMNHLVFKQSEESFGINRLTHLKPLTMPMKSHEHTDGNLVAHALTIYKHYKEVTPAMANKIETLYGFLKISTEAFGPDHNEEFNVYNLCHL